MIKAKITKIDGDIVYLLTEHNDELPVSRFDIDFGVLEGDSLFLRTESGEYKFRRIEKDDVGDGEIHYYDADWSKREDEHQVALGRLDQMAADLINAETEKINQEAERLEAQNEQDQSKAIWIGGIVLVAIIIGAILMNN